jgi:hypothetical protein
VDEEPGFTHEELESISKRAFAAAKRGEDASLRTALQLLGEAAANVAIKLRTEPPMKHSSQS